MVGGVRPRRMASCRFQLRCPIPREHASELRDGKAGEQEAIGLFQQSTTRTSINNDVQCTSQS